MIVTLKSRHTKDKINIEIISNSGFLEGMNLWWMDEDKVYLSDELYKDFASKTQQQKEEFLLLKTSKNGSHESAIKLLDFLPEIELEKPLVIPRTEEDRIRVVVLNEEMKKLWNGMM